MQLLKDFFCGRFFLQFVITKSGQTDQLQSRFSHFQLMIWWLFSTIKSLQMRQLKLQNLNQTWWLKEVALMEKIFKKKRKPKNLIMKSKSEVLWFPHEPSWLLNTRWGRWVEMWAHPALYNYRMSTLFMLSALTFSTVLKVCPLTRRWAVLVCWTHVRAWN